MRKLVAPVALLAVTAGVLALFVWSPWQSRTRDHELEWLRAYASWSDDVEGSSREECTAALAREVGAPPSDRLRPAADIAREACAGPGEPEHLQDVRWRVRSSLIDSRFTEASTTDEPDLAGAVRDVARDVVHVSCWRARDWRPLEEDLNLVDREEYWLLGFADPPRSRIHLSPDVCDPLRRFFETAYQPYLSTQALDLAQAVQTLAHEAEHLRDPYASEAEVECYALQDVRHLVLDRGRGRGYANELAGLAWEIGYPRDLPSYQTRRCRDGGPLDRNPRSPVWP
jgi:hypothetical protein